MDGSTSSSSIARVLGASADRHAPQRLRCRRAFESLEVEHGPLPLRIEGSVPPSLRGALYATGPSKTRLFGESYAHWFDGDGAVSAVHFGDGAAHGAVRLVQSAGLRAEQTAGRMIYGGYRRRFDASLFFRAPGKRGKNVANTAMMVRGGRLFALWEAGLPTEIDPVTLETIGTGAFDDVVRMGFSAHPHHVPARKAAYNFGICPGPKSVLDLFELPDDPALPPRRFGGVPVSPLGMVHDFAATQDHLIFFISPLRLRLLPALLGLSGFDESLAWEPERGTEVVIVPIDAPERQTRFRCEPFYQWHFANAFEHGGQIVIDFCRYPNFGSNEWLRRVYTGEPLFECWGALTRATIQAGEVAFETLWNHPCDFPEIHPAVAGASHRYVYLAAHQDIEATTRGMQDRLAKYDVERNQSSMVDFGRDTFLGQPTFVPDAALGTDEDAGWLLTHVYDARTHETFVAVTDARTLETRARCAMPNHLPFRLHTAWKDS